MLRMLSLLFALLLVLSLTAAGEELTQMYLTRSDSKDYAAYLAKLDGGAAVSASVALYENAEGVDLQEGDSVTLSISVPEDVFGYPVLSYAMTGNNILDNGYTLLLDGEQPYAECSTLTLDSLWTQDGTFDLDRYGNEVVSMPTKSYDVTSCRLMGKAGMYSQGMGLFLTAGEHEITITCREGPFRLYGLTLEGEIPVLEAAQGELTGKYIIALQAEQVPVRNNPNIRPLADYDMHLTPYSSGKKVINHIEDISYKYPGDMLTYSFTVEQPGYYALALRLRQSELANFPVYRTVLVDGVIPAAPDKTAWFTFTTDPMALPAGDHLLSLSGENAAVLTVSAFAHEALEEQTWALDKNNRKGIITLGNFSAKDGALSITSGKNGFALIGGHGCTDYEMRVTFDIPKRGSGFSGFIMHATHASVYDAQVAEAAYGYAVAITNTGVNIRRMNYGYAMDVDKVNIDGWRNLTQATLRLQMKDNTLTIYVGDETEPVAVIRDASPFTHGMCGLFSTGKELRVTELSVRPLD